MTAGSPSMSEIVAGAPIDLRLAAIMASGFRITFALDCCDREAMSFVATTGGISGDHVRDLIVGAVEHRFGRINRLPDTIEWLTDNGSRYVARSSNNSLRHTLDGRSRIPINGQ